jgi:integrase
MKTGSITQRGEYTWRIRYDAPPQRGQKRRQVSETVRGNKRDTEIRLRERLNELGRGEISPSLMTFGELVEDWFDNYAASHVSPRTLYGYRGEADRYLIPALGQIKIGSLRGEHCDALYTQMRKPDSTGKRLSSMTVRHTHRLLSEILKTAVKWELLSRNPADNATPPKVEKKEIEVWDEKTLKQFWGQAQDSPYYHFYKLAYLTGMRRSELCGLRWENVDLDAGVIRVVQTRQQISGMGEFIGRPKTEKSRRAIEIGPATIDLLLAIPNKGEYVFTKENGKPVGPDTVSHDFTLIGKALGLPHLTLHGLRHCHATMLFLKGENPKVVSGRLGHSTIVLTMDTYSHMMPGMQAGAVNAIESTL